MGGGGGRKGGRRCCGLGLSSQRAFEASFAVTGSRDCQNLRYCNKTLKSLICSSVFEKQKKETGDLSFYFVEQFAGRHAAESIHNSFLSALLFVVFCGIRRMHVQFVDEESYQLTSWSGNLCNAKDIDDPIIWHDQWQCRVTV